MREKFLLACALLSAATATAAAEADKKETLRDEAGEPVQVGVFTSRWGRLFSGN